MTGGITTADLLRLRSEDDHVAVLFEGESLSWRLLIAGAASRANFLLAQRRSGPFHVAVLLDNGPEYLSWIVAAAFAGAAVVGVNPTRRGSELCNDISHTDCQVLITDSNHVGLLNGMDLGISQDRLLLVDQPDYQGLLDSHQGDMPEVPVRSDDRFLLLFTSGSTGAPKAVVCTQGRFAGVAERTPAMFGIDRESITYQSMPFFHGNSLMANWAAVLSTGATMALRDRFSASGFLADVRRYRASYFNYVGRAVAYILATPEQPDDRNNPLRLGFGTEASARDMARFAERFGCSLLESYGSSEGAIAIEKVQDAPLSSLGKPRPGQDVAVVDPVSGIECSPAIFDEHGGLLNGDQAIGELVGRNVSSTFEGYYNNVEADRQRLRGGSYWSGDLAYRDADGWFYFAGRGDDWLRVDSENFAAAPIERIIYGFEGVVMVAVFPVPDPRTGDQVMAAIEMEPDVPFDPQAFESFLRRQDDLGTKWAPKFVRILPSMPLTASNKVRKAPLRAERWETADPVYWRADPAQSYQVLVDQDVENLRKAFEEHGRR